MEILGCGMVHPRVLQNAGVDPERYTGWAFGMGPGRITMNRYGITDIRHLYDGDMRLLRQLAEGGRLVAVVGRAPASKAVRYLAGGGQASALPVFDAAGPALPGFAEPPAFVF